MDYFTFVNELKKFCNVISFTKRNQYYDLTIDYDNRYYKFNIMPSYFYDDLILVRATNKAAMNSIFYKNRMGKDYSNILNLNSAAFHKDELISAIKEYLEEKFDINFYSKYILINADILEYDQFSLNHTYDYAGDYFYATVEESISFIKPYKSNQYIYSKVLEISFSNKYWEINYMNTKILKDHGYEYLYKRYSINDILFYIKVSKEQFYHLVKCYENDNIYGVGLALGFSQYRKSVAATKPDSVEYFQKISTLQKSVSEIINKI